MNNEIQSIPNASSGEPNATRSVVPMWILVLTLVLLFLSWVYFDYRSGWFNPNVYTPYASAAQLDAYQPKSGAAATLARGKQVYDTICGICHGVDGMGKPNQAPPLALSEWVNTKSADRSLRVPLVGLNGPLTVKGATWNLSMPAMGAALSDPDLAAVISYIRSAWGNQGGPVTAADVKAARAAVAAHPQPLTSDQLKALPE
ncbi:MAG: cytochrome c [Verrucomicrobiota bacterium]|jgi:mono/diheme cytochrome c family protein